MQPRIALLAAKKLVGKRLKMSLASNKTFALWQSFMLYKKDITNGVSTDLFSMQVYDSVLYFQNFNPYTEFEKWAAAEVIDFDAVPLEMESYTLVGGLYAVFEYKGANTDTQIFEYIYGTWLPNSNYVLDDRPHFEILGEKYKNDSPDSEEEIWIPIKLRE